MNRALAVALLTAGALVAWAGYSDNEVMAVARSVTDPKVKLNKGGKGLERVAIFVAEYFLVRLGLKIPGLVPIPGGGGGGGGGGAPEPVPPEPVPVPEIPIIP